MAIPDQADNVWSDTRAARKGTQIWLPLTAATFGVLLAIIANRGEIYLGFDAFHYVRNARNMFIGNWDAITTTWPLGYPLLGLPLMVLGIHPALSLIVILILSFLLLFVMFDSHLRRTIAHPAQRFVVLTALASLPVWHSMLFTPNSDLPFTVMLFALFTVLVGSNRKPWVIVVSIVSLFFIRYIGFVFLFLPSLTLIAKRVSRRLTMKTNWRITGMVALAILTAAVCNWFMSGSPLGEPRLDMNFDVLGHLRDYGLAFTGVFGYAASGFFENAGTDWVGWIIATALAAFLWFVWHKGNPALDCASIIVALYSLGLIATRSLVWFMPLDSSRFMLPVLPFLALMFVSSMRGAVRTIVAFSLLLTFLGCVQAIRHYESADPMTAVRMAEEYLEPIVQREDVVVTNYEGKSVFRALDADVRFEWAGASFESLLRDASFVILLPKYDHASGTYRMARRWVNVLRDSTYLERFMIRQSREHFHVLEKRVNEHR